MQDIEANLMKRDEQRGKLKERHDQPAAVAKAMELNDAAASRRRGRMMLPAPQVCDIGAPTCPDKAMFGFSKLGTEILALLNHHGDAYC